MSTDEPTNPTEYTDAEINHAFAGMIGPLMAAMAERAVRPLVPRPAWYRAVREIQSLRDQVQELTQDRDQLRLALEAEDEQ